MVEFSRENLEDYVCSALRIPGLPDVVLGGPLDDVEFHRSLNPLPMMCYQDNIFDACVIALYMVIFEFIFLGELRHRCKIIVLYR